MRAGRIEYLYFIGEGYYSFGEFCCATPNPRLDIYRSVYRGYFIISSSWSSNEYLDFSAFKDTKLVIMLSWTQLGV
jgi:hypothetical protein